MIEEEEQEQYRDEEFIISLKQEQEEIQKWHSDYIQLMEYTKNPNYISYCIESEAQRIF